MKGIVVFFVLFLQLAIATVYVTTQPGFNGPTTFSSFQNATNYAVSIGDRDVYLPAGYYILDGGVAINTTISFRGDGIFNTIVSAVVGSFTFNLRGSGANVTMTGIGFTNVGTLIQAAPGATTALYSITAAATPTGGPPTLYFAGNNRVYMENCQITQSPQIALQILGGVLTLNSTRFAFNYNPRGGAIGAIQVSNANVTLVNCQFQSNDGALQMDNVNLTASGNEFFNNTQYFAGSRQNALMCGNNVNFVSIKDNIFCGPNGNMMTCTQNSFTFGIDQSRLRMHDGCGRCQPSPANYNADKNCLGVCYASKNVTCRTPISYYVAVNGTGDGSQWYTPAAFSTLASIINRTAYGDVINFMSGSYVFPSNYFINPMGKAITFKSYYDDAKTVIWSGLNMLARLSNQESFDTVFQSLTFAYCQGGAFEISMHSGCSIRNCSFYNNTNTDTYAPGIWAHDGGFVYALGTRFWGNSIGIPGGSGVIALTTMSSSGQRPAYGYFQSCSFQNNYSAYQGGVIRIGPVTWAFFVQSYFANNYAGDVGGEFWMETPAQNTMPLGTLTSQMNSYYNSSSGSPDGKKQGGSCALVANTIYWIFPIGSTACNATWQYSAQNNPFANCTSPLSQSNSIKADPCKVCGNNAAQNKTMDCAGECFGTHQRDSAGGCCYNQEKDCNGICFGPAVYDSTYTCCANASLLDCNNVCNGPSRNCRKRRAL